MDQANPIEQFETAYRFTRRVIAGIKPEQWEGSTNCDWNVRGLVNHIVTGNRLGIEFINGRIQTMEQVLPFRNRDWLGGDAVAAYDDSMNALREAFQQPGYMERAVKVPYLPMPISGAEFAGQRTVEVVAHGWDAAHSTGQDDSLDGRLCASLYEALKPREQMLRQSGQFGPQVDVPENADAQIKLLALLGRKR